MYYFYAVLNEADDLLHVAGHQHFQEKVDARPPSVDSGIELDLETYPDATTIIEGELARLLFTAVSGRWRHEHPDAASVEKAVYARRVLAKYARAEFEAESIPCTPLGGRGVSSAARRTYDAAVQFGHCYQPWYGQLKVKEGKESKIIGGDDVYQDTTMVLIPVEMWALYMDQWYHLNILGHF